MKGTWKPFFVLAWAFTVGPLCWGAYDGGLDEKFDLHRRPTYSTFVFEDSEAFPMGEGSASGSTIQEMSAFLEGWTRTGFWGDVFCGAEEFGPLYTYSESSEAGPYWGGATAGGGFPLWFICICGRNTGRQNGLATPCF